MMFDVCVLLLCVGGFVWLCVGLCGDVGVCVCVLMCCVLNGVWCCCDDQCG